MVFRQNKWTEEEDKKLRRLVRDSFDWAAISREFEYKRTHEGCKKRWYSVLSKRPDNPNPDGQEGGSGQEFAVVGRNNKMLRLRWTAEEDKKLRRLVRDSFDWAAISREFEYKRSDEACKLRWYSVLSKRPDNPNPDVPVNDHNNPGGGGEEAQEVGTGNENDNTGGGGGGGGGGGAQEVGTENEEGQMWPEEDTKDLHRLLGLMPGNDNDNTGGGGGGGEEAQEVGTENEEEQMWPEEDTMQLNRLLGLTPGNESDHIGGGGGEAQGIGAGSGNDHLGGEGAQLQGTGQGNHKRRRTS